MGGGEESIGGGEHSGRREPRLLACVTTEHEGEGSQQPVAEVDGARAEGDGEEKDGPEAGQEDQAKPANGVRP